MVIRGPGVSLNAECKIWNLNSSAISPIVREFDWLCVQSEYTMLIFWLALRNGQKLASGWLLFCTLWVRPVLGMGERWGGVWSTSFTWPQCMIEDILSVMPYRHTFNEVLVEEPVSECRDMAASNASLPLLISLSLLPQLCLTIFHWVIDGASKYIHAIVSCVRKNLTMLKWNGDKHEQK